MVTVKAGALADLVRDTFAKAGCSLEESERIGKIVLSGGCSKLTGLDDFLGSSWGVPVELARPFQGIEHDAAQFADEDPEQIGPVLAVAVGLALRRPGDKPA